MRLVSHPNVVALKAFFYSNGDKKDEVFLNLVLEYVPETVYRASRHYTKLKQVMPMLYVKVRYVLLLDITFYLLSKSALHVPSPPVFGIHSLTRHLSQRH